MNKWKILGSDAFYRIVKTDLATKEATSVDAQEPMKLTAALTYIVNQTAPGDIIFLPNGVPLSVHASPQGVM